MILKSKYKLQNENKFKRISQKACFHGFKPTALNVFQSELSRWCGLRYDGRAKSSVTNGLPWFYPRYILKCFTALEWCLFRANCFPTDRVISNWNRCSHIHWPIYLLHWNMDQKTEIRSYVKCRIRLNIDSKQIFNELWGIYWPQTISMRTVFKWVKAFKAGKFSVEDDTRPGRPKTSVTKANIAAVKIVVEQDANLLTGDET